MRKIVYSVEGNIGAGKTVLLGLLCKYFKNIVVAPEPVEDWQQINQFNLLQTYYDDPARWAYTFQNYAILTRSKHLHDLIETDYPVGTILFSERSIGADKEIFTKLLYRQKKLTEMEYNLYLRFFDNLNDLYKIPVAHRHIYLRTDPRRCLQRIMKRGRGEQKKIGLDYLQSLHQMHEEWLSSNGSLIIEGTEQFQTDAARLQAMVVQIESWLKSDKASLS